MAILSSSVCSKTFNDGLLSSSSHQLQFTDHVETSNIHIFPQISALKPFYSFLNFPQTFPGFTFIYQQREQYCQIVLVSCAKDKPLSFHTRSIFLKARPSLAILNSFRMCPSLRASHSRYTRLSTFLMV